MTQWYPASPALWQGRDDSIEAPDARRLFQTVTRSETFSPENWQQKIALMGFACDEGVKRNAGRPGAAGAPDALRKALANMASHQGHERLVDLGNWVAPTPDLEGAQQALRDAVSRCLRAGMRTLVLGGGHETAFGHGAGVLDVFAQESVGIINLDAHLDLRQTDRATSGTPFRQLAQLCDAQSRAFHYACFGVSRAANTQALWREAQWRNVTVVEDLDCHDALFEVRSIAEEIAARRHQHRCEVLTLERVRANAIQASALNVNESDVIFHSIMVHYENDLPVQIEDRCVNADIAVDYLTQDYRQTTPHAYLSRIAPLTEGEHIVEAVRATAQECAWLTIKEHEPCLLIRRTTWSASRIVSHARLLFPGSRYRLQGRFIS